MQTPDDAEKDRAGVAPQGILSSSPPKVRSKRCPSCGKKKPGTEFPESGNASDGLFFYCTACYRGYLKNEYFLPRVCWIRGRHAAITGEREALLNLIGDAAIINEFLGRCYSYKLRARKLRAVANRRRRDATGDPVWLCRKCGSDETFIRTSSLSEEGDWRSYYIRCHVCGAEFRRRRPVRERPQRLCPKCGSDDTKIKSTYDPVGGKWRTYYLRCRACQRKFTQTVPRPRARPPKPAGPRPDAQ
jgi:DNA-directed RNA polymerase subunit M/transcription elongation factor TFIIS